MQASDFDVVIVGAGVVGMTAALALAKQTRLQIAIVDAHALSPGWQEHDTEKRVSAISPASQRIFSALNVWQTLRSHRLGVFSTMHVWQELGSAHIDFCDDAPLGYIVEDALMRHVLAEEIQNQRAITVLAPYPLSSCHKLSSGYQLQAENADGINARCVIGADGAHSWLRAQLAVPLEQQDYPHDAIVSTVTSEYAHDNIARQCFLAQGPLAFLPLKDAFSCSIVWSMPPAQARELMALNEADFLAKLSAAFEYKLGKLKTASSRMHFPLRMRHAKQYVGEGFALIGDAAHTVHPLAGQGVNLGLLDAVSLAQVIATACDQGRDFASRTTLRRFERWRKADNTAMLTLIKQLQTVFAQEHYLAVGLRDAGLQSVNRLAALKKLCMYFANGGVVEAPLLAR